jgi:ElaB/YqjD/DUF883 family membrane-anchored ribosome-binding protein
MTMEIAEKIEHAARDVERSLKPQVQEAKRRLDDLQEDITHYIKKNPGKCVLGAFALGLLVGKLARR